MRHQELIDEFIRVERSKSGTRIRVCQITWDGPHTPVSTWTVAATLGGDRSDSAIDEAVSGVLEDENYFGKCGRCGERNPIGWMHDEDTCQSCAEADGVVY